MITIRPAEIPLHLHQVQQLFRAYIDGLGIDLSFQDIEQELASLPGKYAQPQGCILLAWMNGQAAGCVALRPIDKNTAEMKRLYVHPEFRSLRLGHQLVQACLEQARQRGYQRLCLDTLPSMTSAIRLYTDLGFQPTGAYVYNPIPGAMYFEKTL